MRFYWHFDNDTLMTPVTKDSKEQIAYIRKCQPAQRAEVWLPLLRLVKGALPQPVMVALDTYIKANNTYTRTRIPDARTQVGPTDAYVALKNAGIAFKETVAAHRTEIEALHAQECPNCPWNGQTIFPGEE